MRRITCISVLAAIVTAAGCAAMTVSSHIERSADFDRYRTYAWSEPDTLPPGDPRLDNNPFFRDYVQGAVERQLALKGFEYVTSSESPDLLIHYHANVRRRIDVEAVDRQYGYSGTDEPHLVEFEQGTLVVDVIDARTNKLVWRGWAQDSVAGVLDDQDRLDRQVERGVTRMFEGCPTAGPSTATPPRH